MNTKSSMQKKALNAIGPKTKKLHKHKELTRYFKELTKALNPDELSKTDKEKQKNLERQILKVFTEEQYPLEKIIQILSVLLLKQEEMIARNAHLHLLAREARDIFKDIVGIEASIDPGGRPNHMYAISLQICNHYRDTHEGELPRASTLTKLGNQMLEDKLEKYLEMTDTSRKKLSNSDRNFLKYIQAKKQKSEDGIEIYSSRTANEHLSMIRKSTNLLNMLQKQVIA